MTDHDSSSMDPPAYPDSDRANDDHRSPPGARWGSRLVIVAIGLVIAVIVLLHLTGVIGPGTHPEQPAASRARLA